MWQHPCSTAARPIAAWDAEGSCARTWAWVLCRCVRVDDAGMEARCAAAAPVETAATLWRPEVLQASVHMHAAAALRAV